MSELFTQGSVGGAAGNCCSYPAKRIGKLGFYQSYQASKGTFKRRDLAILANRLNSSVIQILTPTYHIRKIVVKCVLWLFMV